MEFNKEQCREYATGVSCVKNRRKSYYPGKYFREVTSVVVLLVLAVILYVQFNS